MLETFLESEFSSENIRFWMSIQDLKYSPNCQIQSKAQRVHDEFLAAGAPYQVRQEAKFLALIIHERERGFSEFRGYDSLFYENFCTKNIKHVDQTFIFPRRGGRAILREN